MKSSSFLRCFVCFCLAALLLVPSALADTVDVKSLSDSEVVELLAALNEEVAARGINKTAKLPKGAYIGGKDIPAGKYIYTCLAAGNDWGNVTVYSDEGAGKQLLWEVVSAPKEGAEPEMIFITLQKGDELKSGVPFSLSVMSGAIFQ